MNKHSRLILLTAVCGLLFFTLLLVNGCHREEEPRLGPTHPTPPPANIQTKGKAVIQGSMPGQPSSGSPGGSNP